MTEQGQDTGAAETETPQILDEVTAPATSPFVPTTITFTATTTTISTTTTTTTTTINPRRKLFRRKGPRRQFLRPKLNTEESNEVGQEKEERREGFRSFPAFRRQNRFRPNKVLTRTTQPAQSSTTTSLAPETTTAPAPPPPTTTTAPPPPP